MTIFSTEIWGRRGADLLGSNLRPHLCVIGGVKLSLEGPLTISYRKCTLE